MSQGKSKNLKNNFFRLITQCGDCKKHITVDLILNIEECPQYGRTKKVNFEYLPKYIKCVLEGAQMVLNTNSIATDSKLKPKCSECIKIDKLKE